MIRILKRLTKIAEIQPLSNVYKVASLIYKFSDKAKNQQKNLKEYVPYLKKQNPSTQASLSTQQTPVKASNQSSLRSNRKDIKNQNPQTSTTLSTEQNQNTERKSFLRSSHKDLKGPSPQILSNLSSTQTKKSQNNKILSQDSRRAYKDQKGRESKRINFTKSVNDYIKEGRQKQELLVDNRINFFEKQLLKSEFHKYGILDQKYKQHRNKLLNSQKIDLRLRRKLFDHLKQLIEERQKLMVHQFSQDWFCQQYQKYINQQSSLIQHYFKIYIQLQVTLKDILLEIQNEKHKENEILVVILDIVKSFRLIKFVQYFLISIKDQDQVNLISIKDQVQVTSIPITDQAQLIKSRNEFSISKQDADYCLFFINKLYQIDVNTHQISSFNTTTSLIKNIYEIKLPLILKQYQGQSLEWKIRLLNKIQRIYSGINITNVEQQFYKHFLNQNIHYFQQLASQNTIQPTHIQNFVDLFHLTFTNLVLEPSFIQNFNSILQTFTNNHLVRFSTDNIQKIIEIYINIGNMPQAIYTKAISKHLYLLMGKPNQKKPYAALKFFVYSNCQDQLFLNELIQNFDFAYNEKEISRSISKTTSIGLGYHKLFHYLSIKYPELKQNQQVRKILNFCWSFQPIDTKLINSMIDRCRDKSHKNLQKQLFVSSCLKKTKLLSKQKHSKYNLNKLQQNIVADHIQFIIKQLNESSKNVFYQMKRNLPICVFELDCAVLKWDSPKKQRLLKYLNIESVGVNYSYDSNTQYNGSGKSRKLNQMSMIDYGKGIILTRRKQFRDEILEHYGWKVLHVLNKYTYTNLIDRKTFQNKLRQAILVKLSQQ